MTIGTFSVLFLLGLLGGCVAVVLMVELFKMFKR